jgi:hypothetical protein
VVNNLTIEKAFCLQQQVTILQKEKDEEISYLRKKDKVKEDAISSLSDQLTLIKQKLDRLEKS